MPNTKPPSPFLNFRNPKRDKESRHGRAGWYDYYAGFSSSFVQDVLSFSQATPTVSRILDPWNGSGTTTDLCTRNGFDAAGFDLNPAMVIVAKARTLQPSVHPSLASILDEIVFRACEVHLDYSEDPLAAWFSQRTVRVIRNIEASCQLILIDSRKYTALGSLESLRNVSALAAFFYVGLFRSLRLVLKPFRSSNPTWIKNARTSGDHIQLSQNEFASIMRTQVAKMIADLAAEDPALQPERIPSAYLDVATSVSLPIPDKFINVVVTSPPYCTRIDYVIKTCPELALLGVGNSSSFRTLRERMIGTPTISKQFSTPTANWGQTCLNLLDSVENHESRASKSYYLKTQLQYFGGIHDSLIEINRALDNSGQCFFVVQDSYYKEIHIDLARIVKEMGMLIGWTLEHCRDFESLRTMVSVNRKARAYNDPPKLAVESVLHFSKS
jgi:hypothetical protein